METKTKKHKLDFKTEYMYLFDGDFEPREFLVSGVQKFLSDYNAGEIRESSIDHDIIKIYGDILKNDNTDICYIPKNEKALLEFVKFKINYEMSKFSFDIDYKKGE